MHQRVDFAASMIDGRTVMELPGAKRSSSEIEQLWSYLAGRIARRRESEARPVQSLEPSLQVHAN